MEPMPSRRGRELDLTDGFLPSKTVGVGADGKLTLGQFSVSGNKACYARNLVTWIGLSSTGGVWRPRRQTRRAMREIGPWARAC